MDHQKILNRVQKMLNLANDAGATEGERDNALRMAHATLAKHNLDMADLTEAKREATAGEERVENVATFYGRPWARQVCSAVGSLFFCSYIYVSHKKATQVRHYFIGRRSNAVTAALLAEFVVKSIMKDGNRQKRQEMQGNAWLRTFCWGAASRVQERVREIREAAEKPEAAQPGTALVLANVYETERQANKQFLAKTYPHLRAGRSGKGHHGGDAYGRGRVYGSSVSLNKQVN
jgi:hypothetical protein